MKPILLASTVAAMVFALAGCATLSEPERVPLTLEQIVERAKTGKDATQIITEIKETRAIYDVSASQYAKLSRDGVPDAVLDFMQSGQIKLAERNGRREAQRDLWLISPAWIGYGPRWYPRGYYIYVNGRPIVREW